MSDAKLVYTHTLDIVWGDLDALGHVNNCRYFEYMQEARIQWLKTLNLDLAQSQGPVVVYVDCSFLKPIFYPATLSIHCLLHSAGRSSVVMDYELYQQDILMAKGSSKMVWVDYQKNQPRPLPTLVRELC